MGLSVLVIMVAVSFFTYARAALWIPVTDYTLTAFSPGNISCAVNNDQVAFRGIVDLTRNGCRLGSMPATVATTVPSECTPSVPLRFVVGGQTLARDMCTLNVEISSSVRVISIACAASGGYPNNIVCSSDTVACIRRVTFDGIFYVK
jgi:hypothetical protein